MELKDFINETSCQIIDGIIQSQAALKKKRVLAVPKGYQLDGAGVGNAFANTQKYFQYDY